MRRRACSIWALSSFLAVTSGLVLNLHAHLDGHAAGEQDQSCDVCAQLMHAPPAALPTATPLVTARDPVPPDEAIPGQDPEVASIRLPVAARAPPTR